MRVLRSALWLTVGALTVAGVGSLTGTRVIVAQNTAAECSVQVQQAVASLRDDCANGKTDSICFTDGSGVSVARKLGAAESGAAATVFSLDSVQNLLSTGLADGKWGVGTMRLTWDAPTGSADVTGLLFGAAELTDDVQADPGDVILLPAKMFDEDPILLRIGASPNFPQAYRLQSDRQIMLDGRSKKGDWVRVRVLDAATGWALATQLDITGDVMTLPELAQTDSLPYFRYQRPLQSFRLSAVVPDAKSGCMDASNGLLLQRAAEKAESNGSKAAPTAVHFMVNGAEIAFESGTLVLRAATEDALSIGMITGSATVTAQGKTAELAAGDAVQVRLDKNGVISGAPKQKTKLAFSALVGVPTGLLAEETGCFVGILKGEKAARAHSGPSEKDFSPMLFLNPDLIYQVVGQNKTSDGTAWYKLANPNAQENWIPQASVHSVGACAAVPSAEPGMVVAVNGEAGSVPDGGGFAPAVRSIWNATPGGDQMEGVCAAPVNFCVHPVSIAPSGGGLLYRGLELKAYYLRKTRENVYSFAGRNQIGDAKITISVNFTSPTSYTLTQVLIRDAEPECKHINVFSGVFVR